MRFRIDSEIWGTIISIPWGWYSLSPNTSEQYVWTLQIGHHTLLFEPCMWCYSPILTYTYNLCLGLLFKICWTLQGYYPGRLSNTARTKGFMCHVLLEIIIRDPICVGLQWIYWFACLLVSPLLSLRSRINDQLSLTLDGPAERSNKLHISLYIFWHAHMTGIPYLVSSRGTGT